MRTLDFLSGNFEGALKKIQTIREMQYKPAEKLTSDLIVEAIIEVLNQGTGQTQSEHAATFEVAFAKKVNALPRNVVQNSIEKMNGTFQFLNNNLYLGSLENQMKISVNENKELTLGDVQSLASISMMLESVLPFAPQIVSVTNAYIEKFRVLNENLWERRVVELFEQDGLSPVVIGIWDSGVDMAIFKKTGQAWINPGEKADGTDSDGNGWIDDLHGIAWDRYANPDRSVCIHFPVTRSRCTPGIDFTQKGIVI